MANFSSASKRLAKNQILGFVTPYPRAMVHTAMTLDSVLAAECFEGSPLVQGEMPPRVSTSQAKTSIPRDLLPPDHLPAHV